MARRASTTAATLALDTTATVWLLQLLGREIEHLTKAQDTAAKEGLSRLVALFGDQLRQAKEIQDTLRRSAC